jgi:hypothetical protein
MAILQGSSYRLPIRITDGNGNVITSSMVEDASFVFGDLRKGLEDVSFEGENWIVPLTQEETFALAGVFDWQARFKLTSGAVVGTIPQREYIYDSIDNVVLGGGENA